MWPRKGSLSIGDHKRGLTTYKLERRDILRKHHFRGCEKGWIVEHVVEVWSEYRRWPCLLDHIQILRIYIIAFPDELLRKHVLCCYFLLVHTMTMMVWILVITPRWSVMLFLL